MAENTEKARKLSHDEGDLDGKTETSPSFEGNAAHAENMDADQLRRNINAKIANPLAGYSHAECRYLSASTTCSGRLANTTFLQWPNKVKLSSASIMLAMMRIFALSVLVPSLRKIPTDMRRFRASTTKSDAS
jgi:hypothetical protein